MLKFRSFKIKYVYACMCEYICMCFIVPEIRFRNLSDAFGRLLIFTNVNGFPLKCTVKLSKQYEVCLVKYIISSENMLMANFYF